MNVIDFYNVPPDLRARLLEEYIETKTIKLDWVAPPRKPSTAESQDSSTKQLNQKPTPAETPVDESSSTSTTDLTGTEFDFREESQTFTALPRVKPATVRVQPMASMEKIRRDLAAKQAAVTSVENTSDVPKT